MKHSILPNSQLKITVITVVLNDKVGLEETINSVLIQTYKNLEYIVIDGNSNDGSVAVIKKYVDKITYWVSETDTGMYEAMNKGIRKMTGDYGLFMNAGDVFAENTVITDMVNEIIKFSTKKPIPIIYGDVAMYENGVYKELQNIYPWIPHQGALVSGELLRKYLFDESLRLYGDMDLWTRMRQNGDYKCYYIPILVCNFRLGGVGSNLNNLKSQYVDRVRYYVKHGFWVRLVLKTVVFVIQSLMLKLIPNQAVYCIEKMRKAKTFFRKLFIKM